MDLICNVCGGKLKKLSDNVYRCEACENEAVLSDNYVKNGDDFNAAQNEILKRDFDGANAIYDKIIEKNPRSAEAYFGKLMCDYGIEYVVDPKEDKRVPIFNDVSNTPVRSMPNYIKAIELAGSRLRAEYELKAHAIEEVRKTIIEKAGNSEYDVFLCQKIRDKVDGKKTREYDYCRDLYYKLQGDGYKVFFSEKSLGAAVESDAVIYNALYSSKVMIVTTSSLENVESVWVKSEWARFANMIKNGVKHAGSLVTIAVTDDDSIFPPQLRRLQFLKITDPTYMDKLMATLERFVEKKEDKKEQDSAEEKNYVAPKAAEQSRTASVKLAPLKSVEMSGYFFLEENGEFRQIYTADGE